MSQLRVVLLGLLGHGKTFLFNKITLANEPEYFAGDSATKQIVIGEAAYGQFEIVDTPGFGALEDKVLHAAGVIAALAQGDVNRILIVVKCDRTDIMINNLKRIIGSIQNYRDLITIIVSHWDHLKSSIPQKQKSIETEQKQEEEAKQKIEQAIKKYFNICSVIYTSKPDDPEIITKMITDIILQSRLAKIHLEASEIYSQFDLLSLDEESETEFNQSIKKIKIGFRKITKSYLKCIQSLQLDDKNLIDKLHYLQLEIKKIANENIEKFEKQHGDYMNETYDTDRFNVRYLHNIYLKKEIRLDVEEVIKKAQEKMKVSYNHCFFNFIKQCPYCGEVWIKVVGCDRETTCGNRVYSSLDDLSRKSCKQNRYRIIIKNDSIHFEIEEDDNQQAIKQNLDIFQILYDSVKDDILYSKDSSDTFKYFYLFQIVQQYLHKFFDQERLQYYQENMNEGDLQVMIKDFKHMLQENGLLINSQKNLIQDQQKSFGCGRKIVWKDLPPLSGPLLKQLLTPELIDYFNDQKQLLQNEAEDIAKELQKELEKELQKQLQKTYKDLMNQAIEEQKKNIKLIPKQQSQMQAEKDTEK